MSAYFLRGLPAAVVSETPRTAADIYELVDSEPTSGPSGRLDWLQRLCRVAARTLPATGAGVSLMDSQGSQSLAAASDDASELIEELQFVLGEGPCMDAYRSRRLVLAPDLGQEANVRWPTYAPAAREQGVQAVFAFPLQIGEVCLGVLDVYRVAPGHMSQSSLDEARLYARIALMRLLSRRQTLLSDPQDHLSNPLGYRLEVYQAQGMIQVQLGVSAAEALVRLRAYAYANDHRISDVAQDVISRWLVLEHDHGTPKPPSGGAL